jgi:hypothetical protein
MRMGLVPRETSRVLSSGLQGNKASSVVFADRTSRQFKAGLQPWSKPKVSKAVTIQYLRIPLIICCELFIGRRVYQKQIQVVEAPFISLLLLEPLTP